MPNSFKNTGLFKNSLDEGDLDPENHLLSGYYILSVHLRTLLKASAARSETAREKRPNGFKHAAELKK